MAGLVPSLHVGSPAFARRSKDRLARRGCQCWLCHLVNVEYLPDTETAEARHGSGPTRIFRCHDRRNPDACGGSGSPGGPSGCPHDSVASP